MFVTKFNTNSVSFTSLPFFDNIYNFLDGELLLGFIIFFATAVLVVASAMLAPRLLIRLFDKTKINNGFISVFLVAVITSAPEFISVIFSPHLADATETQHKGLIWAFTNVFGANLLAGIILMIFQIFFFRQIWKHPKFKVILRTIPFILLFNAFYLVLLFFPNQILDIHIPKVEFLNLFTFLIIGFYVLISFFLFFRNEPKKLLKIQKRPVDKYLPNSTSGLIIYTIIAIAVLIFSMLAVLSLSNIVEKGFKTSAYFTGGIVIAIITIFPEILSALSFFLMGMFASGVGVFVGSQIFNMVLLSLLVGFNSEQIKPVFHDTDDKTKIVAMLVSVMAVNVVLFVNYATLRFKRKVFFFIAPVLILSIFLFYWIYFIALERKV